MNPGDRRPYDRAKRACDLLTAAAGLLLTAPLQAVVALAVIRQMGRPVLFRQQRPGRDGLPFVLVKFRTMQPLDARGAPTDAERLTPLGRRLRAASLDELPTLWNVLRGDMSLVGPRPLLMSYLDLYTAEQARRHAVRPGITGLAQVSGRNDLPWAKRFTLDVRYVEQRSAILDLRILARTPGTVLRRRGVQAAGHATMYAYPGPASVPGPP